MKFYENLSGGDFTVPSEKRLNMMMQVTILCNRIVNVLTKIG
jgi:hypothetical protein